MSNTFSLLTYNCFGLWLPGTQQRLLALARELEQSQYQVVCLQEIQLHRYRELLVNASPSYPYAYSERYMHCPAGGLLTLSRIGLTDTSFIPYEERGLWYTPMLLDRLFYKGMLVTKLTWENIPVTIINTHILANFAGDWKRRGMYARVEERQLEELAETVRAQSTDSFIVVVGDFNVPRGGALYDDFIEHSGLTDPLAGDTRSTLRAPLGMHTSYTLAIDYVLFRMPIRRKLKVACDLCFVEKYPSNESQQGYLSDHCGIEMQITVDEI
jgi:endonuclease/exonuclease/phosphatase family metal-dependent hydrolase